nr:MAG TPA: hypothetical protein [Caudoviricetes sp.]
MPLYPGTYSACPEKHNRYNSAVRLSALPQHQDPSYRLSSAVLKIQLHSQSLLLHLPQILSFFLTYILSFLSMPSTRCTAGVLAVHLIVRGDKSAVLVHRVQGMEHIHFPLFIHLPSTFLF